MILRDRKISIQNKLIKENYYYSCILVQHLLCTYIFFAEYLIIFWKRDLFELELKYTKIVRSVKVFKTIPDIL